MRPRRAGGSGEAFAARDLPVLTMPSGLFGFERPPGAVEQWADAAAAALDERGTAMVAVGRGPSDLPDLPQALTGHVCRLVGQVLRRRTVDRLFVEGGGTASALARHLKWRRMTVCREYAPGVVALRPHGRTRPVLTIKPGSYRWPEDVWKGDAR